MKALIFTIIFPSVSPQKIAGNQEDELRRAAMQPLLPSGGGRSLRVLPARLATGVLALATVTLVGVVSLSGGARRTALDMTSVGVNCDGSVDITTLATGVPCPAGIVPTTMSYTSYAPYVLPPAQAPQILAPPPQAWGAAPTKLQSGGTDAAGGAAQAASGIVMAKLRVRKPSMRPRIARVMRCSLARFLVWIPIAFGAPLVAQTEGFEGSPEGRFDVLVTQDTRWSVVAAPRVLRVLYHCYGSVLTQWGATP